MFSRQIAHTYTAWDGGTVQRGPSTWFSPPKPSTSREPGTNYLTAVSAEGPMTIILGTPQVIPTYRQQG